MARGPKKHMKRLYAPQHWMLDKLSGWWKTQNFEPKFRFCTWFFKFVLSICLEFLIIKSKFCTGVWAPRPSTGPHKLRECLPLAILLRNRLKYALTYQEVKMIVMQRLIKVDGKVEEKFPKENFRVNREMRDEILVYDLFLTKFWTKMASKCRENAGKNWILGFRF